MIVKKLRKNNNWSQEQLASFCGVSLRTIQRVKAGNTASLDTLKSLASVFEIEISKLTEEITVIDKTTENWKSEPWWIRFGAIGIRKRAHFIIIEYGLIVLGLVSWSVTPLKLSTPLAFIGAYLSAKIVAYIDTKDYW